MSDYVPFSLETEPGDLLAEAYAFLQDRLPGWVPQEGNLDVIILEALAQQAAETRDLAADVPPSIFRSFGKIAGLPPIEALAAWATSSWTMIDALGHTIPAGTLVAIDGPDNQALGFEVLADVVVPAASVETADGEVVLVAVEPGAAASGLAGPVTLLDPLDFVASVALEDKTGAAVLTANGIDAETDDAYLTRLTSLLQLLAPRPILPPDFALLLQETIAGVERAMAVDGTAFGGGIDTNELERLTVEASGGTYKLVFSGQTTANINHPATPAQIQAALEALSNIAPGDVIVTADAPSPPNLMPGPPGPPLSETRTLIEFAGAYLHTDVPELTFTALALTGIGASATVETRQQGGHHATGDGRTVVIAAVDVAGEPVSKAVKEAGRDKLQAEREVNFLVLVVDPTYTSINVDFHAIADPGFAPADVRDAGIAALTAYLSPANWGQPDFGNRRTWVRETTVYYNEVMQVLNSVPGLKRVTSLGMHAAPNVTTPPVEVADIALSGDAPLTRAGAITGTVVPA